MDGPQPYSVGACMKHSDERPSTKGLLIAQMASIRQQLQELHKNREKMAETVHNRLLNLTKEQQRICHEKERINQQQIELERQREMELIQFYDKECALQSDKEQVFNIINGLVEDRWLTTSEAASAGLTSVKKKMSDSSSEQSGKAFSKAGGMKLLKPDESNSYSSHQPLHRRHGTVDRIEYASVDVYGNKPKSVGKGAIGQAVPKTHDHVLHGGLKHSSFESHQDRYYDKQQRHHSIGNRVYSCPYAQFKQEW